MHFVSLFVGRVARAGRSGTAYSIIGPDELAYLIDLHLFLGRPVKYANSNSTKGKGYCIIFIVTCSGKTGNKSKIFFLFHSIIPPHFHQKS